jgi:hypothetical protein
LSFGFDDVFREHHQVNGSIDFMWVHAGWLVLAVSKFGNDLGPNVRLWAYTYLIRDKSSYRLMTQGASKTQRRFARLLLPVIQLVVDQDMSVTKPGQREKSLAVVESVFKEVGCT